MVPKFKKLFEKNNVKKGAAAEACKTFDDAKVSIYDFYWIFTKKKSIFKIIYMHMQEDYSKEFEEKKSELQAKVIEIYEASADEIKVVYSQIHGFLFKFDT